MPDRDRDAPLEMDGARFRELGYRAVDHVADLLDSLRDRPVNHDISPTQVRALLPAELPLEGQDPKGLLDETARALFDHSLFNGHPNFLGYITSSAAPIGALADLLAASVNPNLGGWQLSPVASEIEGQTVRWIGEPHGLPDRRRATRQRRQHGQHHGVPRGASQQTWRGGAKRRSGRGEETSDHLRFERNSHLAPEGRGHFGPRDRQPALDRCR